MDDNTAVGTIYAGFAQEISDRLAAIEEAVRLAVTVGADRAYFHAEFAFMQLRLVCELVALAALWVHREKGLSKKLEGAWHVDEIFKELETINDKCFPFGCRMTFTQDGGYQVVPRPEAVMKRYDLTRIYGQCGNVLHRGALKLFLSGQSKNYDLDFVRQSAAMIKNLLSEHMVIVIDLGIVVLCNMGANGKPVQVITAHAVGPIFERSTDLS